MNMEDSEKLIKAHNLVREIRMLLSEIELCAIPDVSGTNIFYTISELEDMDEDFVHIFQLLDKIIKRVMPMYRGS